MKPDLLAKKMESQKDNALLLAILVVLIIVMSSLKDSFFTFNTFQSIAFQLPEMGILTLAMMITMITGGINLSVIASANLSGILMALIMTRNIPEGQDNIGIVILAILAGMAVCLAVGVLNGVVIAYFRVPDILATLGTQMLINGICLVVTHGEVIAGYPPSFSAIGNGELAFIPTPFWIFIICTIIMAVVLRRTSVGQQAYMYGSNPVAARFSGVNTKKMLLKVYVLSGFFVGAAAMLLTSRFNSAAAGYAESYLLQAVLIAVLGGTDPNGGRGRVAGVVLAVIILQVVASGLNLIRASQYLTTALWGIILLLSVWMRMDKKR
jgi:simple sugar transport system permease protein